MKKILIISPTPTHLPHAGNRQHILGIANAFKKLNHTVFFLYLAYENYDEAELRKYWANSLAIVPREILYKPLPLIKRAGNRGKKDLRKYYQYIRYKIGKIDKEQYLYNHFADDYVSQNLKPLVKQLQRQHKFDVVVCEYAFISKLLDYFEAAVTKIIDTHDRFTDRFRVYINSGMKPQWVSFYKEQERKALRRANSIIALKDEEQIYFNELTNRKCITYISVPELCESKSESINSSILYFGSDNSINLKSLQHFEKEVLPLIEQQHKDILFFVGGKICDSYKPVHTKTILKGKFEDPGEFYSMGNVVVNPELGGTGFKIKTLEAMAYRKPVVTTVAGAQGIAAHGDSHLAVCANSIEFAEEVNRLLSSSTARLQQVKAADEWVTAFAKKMENNLAQLLV